MPDFPEDVARFIRRAIDSVELLEVLLLLREDPERDWTVDELTATFRSSRSSIYRRVKRLVRYRLAGSDGDRFRYRSRAEHDALVDALRTLYRDRRLTVIDRIYASTPNSLRSFSAAFKLRRDGDDG